MTAMTTIQLPKTTLLKIKAAKEYPRQTYAELVERAVAVFHEARKNNQYDEFLHKIQQEKMKELWGSKEDEAWDHA